MNRTLFALLLILAAAPVMAAPPPANIRTIKNLPDFPIESLRVGINRPLFRSLSVSPVSAWVVAREMLIGGRTMNAKIIHSEANGAYDQMALEFAHGYSVTGQNTVESRAQSDSLTVHLLIYEIKDGKMAVCFSHTDDSRYAGYRQGGIAWVGIWKGGKWNTISRPDEKKWRER